MKRIISLALSMAIFQWSIAGSGIYGSEPHPSIKIEVVATGFYDVCMDQYNQQSQLNEWMYSYMVYQCYGVFQFPYSTQCHSEAILNWSSAQDVIFEQLMYCQSANAGKTVPGQR